MCTFTCSVFTHGHGLQREDASCICNNLYKILSLKIILLVDKILIISAQIYILTNFCINIEVLDYAQILQNNLHQCKSLPVQTVFLDQNVTYYSSKILTGFCRSFVIKTVELLLRRTSSRFAAIFPPISRSFTTDLLWNKIQILFWLSYKIMLEIDVKSKDSCKTKSEHIFLNNTSITAIFLRYLFLKNVLWC